MRVYRVVWVLFCGVLGAAGAVMALTWSLSSLIMLVVLAAIMGAVVALVASANPGKPTPQPRDRRRTVARSVILAAGGTVSFIGLGTLLGAPTAVLVVAIVVGGSPYSIRYCRGWLNAHGQPAGSAPQPDRAERSSRSARVLETQPDQATTRHFALDDLSDEALCLAWRVSFSTLQRAETPSQWLRIVEERAAYLDEIERRTAQGMAAWLASGPRAAGDPSRFVLGDRAAGRAAPIDWDNFLHDTDK